MNDDLSKFTCFEIAKETDWTSLKLTTKNLKRIYKRLGANIISIDPSGNEVTITSAEAHKNLIFYCHHFHPLDIYEKNAFLHLEERFIHIFHIYGDFVLYLDKWARLLNLLKNKKVIFVSCSQTFSNYLQSLVIGGSFEVIPHPINTEVFDRQGRELENNFIYTGRVTDQKNIHLLLIAFEQYKKITKSNKKLILCGPIDSEGLHFRGRNYDKSLHFSDTIMKYINNSRLGIEYHGMLEQRNLVRMYRRAKFSISPSTFHDEDFGRCLAEGAMMGLAPIGTKWCGYKDILATFKNVSIPIDIGLQRTSYRPILNSVLRALLIADGSSPVVSDIESIAKKNYSIEAVEKKVLNFNKKKVKKQSGLSPFGLQLLSLYQSGRGPVYEIENKLYRENYERFV